MADADTLGLKNGILYHATGVICLPPDSIIVDECGSLIGLSACMGINESLQLNGALPRCSLKPLHFSLNTSVPRCAICLNMGLSKFQWKSCRVEKSQGPSVPWDETPWQRGLGSLFFLMPIAGP